MAAGYPAPLLPLALVVSSVPAAAAVGYVGLLAFWAGGGGASSGAVTAHFYRQMHHRMGRQHVTAASEVPQKFQEIG